MDHVTGPSSVDELYRHLTAITREVRLSGTPEEARAFDYIEEQLTGWGYEVKRYQCDAYTGYPLTASLSMIAPHHQRFDANGYSLSPVTALPGLEGDLIYAGAGSEADLGIYDIPGKILLTDGMATPEKVLNAARAGAIGHIHSSGERIYEMCISPIWGTPTPETAGLLPAIPSIGITNVVAQTLRAALESGPVRVNLSTQPYLGWSTLPILTADLPGEEEDTYVLFSGHVDSWHLGVMDNGTANATQLEVARLLSEQRSTLKRGIRIAFWSGHSHARYAGSTWYADTFHDDIATRCVCHVNIDSVGAKGAVLLDQAPSMAETFSFLKDILAHSAGTKLTYQRISRSSDQSFWGHGVPTVLAALSYQDTGAETAGGADRPLFGMGNLGWWWHTPEDTLDKIDLEFLKRDCNIYYATLHSLLTSRRIPFDPAAGLLEMAHALDAYGHESDGKLPVSDLSEKARALANRAGRERLSNLDDAATNDLISDLLRVIIPVNFTEHGPYGHDLALGTEPLPGLKSTRTLATLDPESTEYRLLRTKLVRERNRISGALRHIDRILLGAGL